MKKMNFLSKILGLIVIIMFITLYFYWQNNDIMVTRITYVSEKVPKDFEDFVIVQLSDLHNKEFEEDQSTLLTKVEESNPDLIVFTGDLIDSSRKGSDHALQLIEALVTISPVFYVSGNHEAAERDYIELKTSLISFGVTVLDHQKVAIQRGNSSIYIIGMEDPNFGRKDEFVEANGFISTNTNLEENGYHEESGLKEEHNSLNILLAHRPELMSMYKNLGFDLVFTGHAHGGQFRFPFIDGVYAPGQGLFPTYTGGYYQEGNTAMIVNRGLGNSIIPIRIGNRPEIVVVTLKSTE